MAKKSQAEIEKEILEEAKAEVKKEIPKEKKPEVVTPAEKAVEGSKTERKVQIGAKKRGNLLEQAKDSVAELKAQKQASKDSKKEKGSKPKLERVYTIPIKQLVPLPKRTRVAVRNLRNYVKKHMKIDDVVIGADVNEYIWARGYKKPPAKIRVKVETDDDGRALVSLQNE